MTRPQPIYRLTEAGKRLWRLYMEFTLCEVDEATFIAMLTEERPIWGKCLSCGHDVKLLAATVFCIGCTAATYRKVA